jgi:hypothetical protein
MSHDPLVGLFFHLCTDDTVHSYFECFIREVRSRMSERWSVDWRVYSDKNSYERPTLNGTASNSTQICVFVRICGILYHQKQPYVLCEFVLPYIIGIIVMYVETTIVLWHVGASLLNKKCELLLFRIELSLCTFLFSRLLLSSWLFGIAFF